MAADARAPRVAIRTLGCKVNRAESEAVADALHGAGAAVVDEDEADVVVINSCTVTAEADAKTRKAVRRALAAPNAPMVVVTGCMAALDGAALRALGDRVVVEPDKDAVAGRVADAAREGSGAQTGFGRGPLGAPGSFAPRRRLPRPAELAADPSRTSAHASAHAPRTRVAVKVQDGCDDRCAYCIVPDARGVPRSVPADDVVGRVRALNAAGTAEVVLTGVNIGRYRDGGVDFAALVERVAGTGVRRIRISSIEPVDLTPRLLETLAHAPAVMPHLHVPLQSGCDRTLAAMRRPYDADAFAGAVARAREALPRLAVTTDVIVGFPGETDADFAGSLALVESMGFTRLHVFRYSRRPGTPAADMPGQVDPRTSAVRASAMRDLGQRLAAAHALGRVGYDASVLVERVVGRAATGTSEDYLSVTARLDGLSAVSPGDVVGVTLTAAERGGASGRLARC